LSQYFSYIINVSFILIEIAENSSPSVNKRQRKPKEQSRMDNPETQATWDTRQIEDKEKKQQQKTQTTKMIISKCLTKFVTYDCIEFTLSRTAVNFLHLSVG
jgi:hypothetical protein